MTVVPDPPDIPSPDPYPADALPGTEGFNARDYLVPFAALVFATLFLWLVSLYNFALYHTSAEFITIAISVAIFLLIWNSRRIIDNNYLLFIGVTFIFIAVLDFLHTLVYQGIGIFPDGGGVLSTQLWIAARYMQAVTLLAAPLFIRRNLRLDLIAIVYLAADILIVASIFIFHTFPATYIPGTGLTPFKVVSEYIISLLLIGSVILLYRNRDTFDRHVLNNLVIAIFLTIAAELTFTEYASFTDIFSLLGHVFRLVSYYFFYRAIIVVGQEKPYNLLYRTLNENERKYRALSDLSPDAIIVVIDGKIVYTNEAGRFLSGIPVHETLVGRDFQDFVHPDEQEEAAARLASVLEEQVVVPLSELRILTGGKTTMVEATAGPVLWEGKNAAQVVIRDITERKKTEERLRNQAKILSVITDAIIVVDTSLCITSWNTRAEELYGWREEEVLGEPAKDILCSAFIGMDRDEAYARLGRGESVTMESVQYTRDNRQRRVRGYTVPLTDAGGIIAGYVAVNHDITDRWQAEEALRESERTAHAILEATKESIWLFDTDGTILMANPTALERLGGRDAGAVIGHPFTEFMSPDVATARRARLDEVIRSRRPLRFEDAREGIVFDHSFYPVFDGTGTVTGIVSFSQDITERRNAEAALRSAHEQTKMILESISDSFLALDRDWRFTYVNSRAIPRELASDTVIGRTIWEVYPEIVGTPLETFYREAMKQGKPMTFENRSIIAPGRIFELHSYPTGNGGLAIFGQDITGRKQMEEELKRRNESLIEAHGEVTRAQEKLQQTVDVLTTRESQLQDALAEKEILLSEVHHRVKNNLSAFISLLSLDGTYADTDSGRALRNDLQNRARSMALIHETLYQTGKFSSVEMETYLTNLVGQIAASYAGKGPIRTRVEARGIVLDLSRATTAGLIINELVTNSFKYAFPPGFDCIAARGEPCTIHVTLVSEDGTFVLTVGDNGCGLPPGFDPLATKSLGLKLVKFLARHQLRADVAVRQGRGTEFVFRLHPGEGFP
jgi:PAS domain S-box-containing protein